MSDNARVGHQPDLLIKSYEMQDYDGDFSAHEHSMMRLNVLPSSSSRTNSRGFHCQGENLIGLNRQPNKAKLGLIPVNMTSNLRHGGPGEQSEILNPSSNGNSGVWIRRSRGRGGANTTAGDRPSWFP